MVNRFRKRDDDGDEKRPDEAKGGRHLPFAARGDDKPSTPEDRRIMPGGRPMPAAKEDDKDKGSRFGLGRFGRGDDDKDKDKDKGKGKDKDEGGGRRLPFLGRGDKDQPEDRRPAPLGRPTSRGVPTPAAKEDDKDKESRLGLGRFGRGGDDDKDKDKGKAKDEGGGRRLPFLGRGDDKKEKDESPRGSRPGMPARSPSKEEPGLRRSPFVGGSDRDEDQPGNSSFRPRPAGSRLDDEEDRPTGLRSGSFGQPQRPGGFGQPQRPGAPTGQRPGSSSFSSRLSPADDDEEKPGARPGSAFGGAARPGPFSGGRSPIGADDDEKEERPGGARPGSAFGSAARPGPFSGSRTPPPGADRDEDDEDEDDDMPGSRPIGGQRSGFGARSGADDEDDEKPGPRLSGFGARPGLSSRLGGETKDEDRLSGPRPGGLGQPSRPGGFSPTGPSSSRPGAPGSTTTRPPVGGTRPGAPEERRGAEPPARPKSSAPGGMAKAAAPTVGGIGARPTSKAEPKPGKKAEPAKPERPKKSEAAQPRAKTKAEALPRSRGKGALSTHQGLDFDRKIDLIGLTMVAASLVTLFAVLPSMSFGIMPPVQGGLTGSIDHLLSQLLGWGKVVLPLAGLALGVWLMRESFEETGLEFDYFRIIGGLLLFGCVLTWLHFFELVDDPRPTVASFSELSHHVALDEGRGGGWFGHQLYLLLLGQLGDFGAVSVMIAWLIVAIMFTFELTLTEIAQMVVGALSIFKLTPPAREKQVSADDLANAAALPVTRPGEEPIAPAPPAPAIAAPGVAAATAPRTEAPPAPAPDQPPVRQQPLIRRRVGVTNGDSEEVTPPAIPVAPGATTGPAGASTLPVAPQVTPDQESQPSRRRLPRLRPSKEQESAAPAAPTPAVPTGPAADAASGTGRRGLLGGLLRWRGGETVEGNQPAAAPDAALGTTPAVPAEPVTPEAPAPPSSESTRPPEPLFTPRGAVPSVPETKSDAPSSEGPVEGLRRFDRPFNREQPAREPGPPARPFERKPETPPDSAKPAESPSGPLRRFGPTDRPLGLRRPIGIDEDEENKPAAPPADDQPAAPAPESPPVPAAEQPVTTPPAQPQTDEPPARPFLKSPSADDQDEADTTTGVKNERPASPAPALAESSARPFATPPAAPSPADDGKAEHDVALKPPIESPKPEAKPENDPAAAAPEPPAHPAFSGSLPPRPSSSPFVRSPQPSEAENEKPDEAKPSESPAEKPATPAEPPTTPVAETKTETPTGEKPATPAGPAASSAAPLAETAKPAARVLPPAPPARVRPPLHVDDADEDQFDDEDDEFEDEDDALDLDDEDETPRPRLNVPLRPSIPARPTFPRRTLPGAATPPPTRAPGTTAPAPSTPPPRPGTVPPAGERLAQPGGSTTAPPARPTAAPPSATPARPTPPAPASSESSPPIRRSEPAVAAARGTNAPETRAAARPAGARWELPDYRQILRKGDEQRINDEVLLDKARVIEDTLASFGAPGKVVEVNPGPVITQFGVEPDYLVQRSGKKTRVKVGSIARLDADLALALAAKTIRIEAPVPGKGFVGIEVPNNEVALVGLYDVMDSAEFNKIDSKLRIALGLSVDGTPVAADLTAMPHLLIAGTTGSGKSVCVNSIISCLLLCNTPDDVQFIMVDPKRVELTGYNGIPHLVAPVVVDLERIVGVLQWVQREMEERYRKFAAIAARNILDYNSKLAPGEKKMPYYVVVVDELADLMMLAPDETERLLARLAQMARATGIHLIISTQRPSVDIITGLIKANFPARIAFAVASSVDSRVILDQPGAEKLLGRGDMLYQSPDAAAPHRLQGVFVSDEEINRITRFWKNQAMEGANGGKREINFTTTTPAAPPANARKPEVAQPTLWDSSGAVTVSMDNDDENPAGEDELYEQAVELVTRLKKASVSLLQRRLRIGYTRAARLIDRMEQEGIVGPAESGSKPREVLK